MKITPFTETRTTQGRVLGNIGTLFYDGRVVAPGSGTGNVGSQREVGALHGNVKVTLLRNGRVSLREVGIKGSKRLVHIDAPAFCAVSVLNTDGSSAFAGSAMDLTTLWDRPATADDYYATGVADDLLRAGQRIASIKACREAGRWFGLMEAKQAMERREAFLGITPRRY